MTSNALRLTCPLCGQTHRPIPLAPGERALCSRCETVLARGSRWGGDGALAFSLTGLLLAPPALLLPFVTVGKFGQERTELALTSVEGLWENGMPLLGTWVLLCGAFVPVALLAVMAAGLIRGRLAATPQRDDALLRGARAMGFWAMPEVQVLAVLVALTKLGSMVNVTIGAGFWFYIGLTLALLLAWRSFLLRSTGENGTVLQVELRTEAGA